MEKSGKCYYVIIKNKKRWKFSGAGPIQVAKKVASKKLKAGKEIEFYLDKVAGKKKRYGPYQARKDKKTGKISVIKARKVMKGGLLSHSDRQEIREIFYRFNDNLLFIPKNKNDKPSYIKTFKLPFVSFFNEPIIFFDPSIPSEYIKKYHYKYALFKEPNGNIYVIIYDHNELLNIVSFAEFFLNPHYLSIINREIIINELKKNLKENEAKTIKQNLLLIELVVINKKYTAIYLPDYSRPLIRKCVYPDLTFGILDEERSARIPQNKSDFPKPESPYQKYLIYKNTGISRMSFNEPIIYVRNPSAINPIEVEELKQQMISEKSKNKNLNGTRPIQFDYCIYYSSNTNKLIIIGNNYEQTLITNNNKLRELNPIIFYILLCIPVQFGEFRRIREVSESIIKYHNSKRELPSQLHSIIKNSPKNYKKKQLEEKLTQLQQIIESLKLLEPKEPEAKLNKAYRILSIFPQLKTQLNQIQSLIKQLQPQPTLKQPQQTLEQQLIQLQRLLEYELFEKKKQEEFLKNSVRITPLKIL